MTDEFLESVGVIVNTNGSTSGNFKLEADLIDIFRDEGVDLSNKINSPGKTC